jgi:hypothetical protein
MTVRRRIATLLILGAIASWGGALGLAGAAQATTSCGAPHSSAGSTYAGQGQQISPGGCQSSALPFTGLDLPLVAAAGVILVAVGMVVRWRLRNGGQ